MHHILVLCQTLILSKASNDQSGMGSHPITQVLLAKSFNGHDTLVESYVRDLVVSHEAGESSLVKTLF